MSETQLMQGFPPSPETQVSLSNWRTAPYNRWAFHHVREIVASADIPNDPESVAALPTASRDLDQLAVEGVGSLTEFLVATDTDGIVILHDGHIVFESYANGLDAFTPHILMSVSKSLLGLIAGILIEDGSLDPNALVAD